MNLVYEEYKKSPINSTAEKRPNIAGLAQAGSTVKVYIDDTLAAEFTALGDAGTVVDFAVRPETDLSYSHRAYYEIWNESGDLTSRSFELLFRVVDELPAPTILTPTQEEDVAAQPLISGVTNDHDTVKIFIDSVLYGTTSAQSEGDNTGHFEYSVPWELEAGQHAVQAQAEDSNGKRSVLSESLIIYVSP